MKKNLFIILFFTSATIVAVGKNKMLTSSYPTDFLSQNIVSQKDFKPFPSYRDPLWDNVPEVIKQAYIKEGERHLAEDWPAVPAMLFTEFRKNGNRSRYEFQSFARRDKLIKLMHAELLEHKGRFMNDIVNGIWAVCEETWWGTSAHYGPNLPDVKRKQEVDLMQAETGAMLACANYLFKQEFDKISPHISKRISHEIQHKILEPCATQKFWWMNAGMNWNTWISSNWILCILLEEPDQAKRASYLTKAMLSVDGFIDSYADDGGCDEGPGYWARAAASLNDCLQWLSIASDHKINIYNEPKIQEMGRFIYKMYISNGYCVNFADAKPKFSPDISAVYRYGKAINDSTMMKFASLFAKKNDFYAPKDSTMIKSRPFLQGMPNILAILPLVKELKEVPTAEPLGRDSWFPNLNVMVARSNEDSISSLFLAAKGGHNNEAHNHNDMGNFIVYSEGKPLIIDVGVGTYEKNTFNDQRYTIWTMQSGYHNTATINGIDQKNGKQYKATDVKYKSTNASATLSMDISKAYPSTAKVEKWIRDIKLIRNKKVEIKEQFKLTEYIAPSKIQLMTVAIPVNERDNSVILTTADGKEYEISYDSRQCNAIVEEMKITDPVLIALWGEKVYRIFLVVSGKNLENSFTYSIIPIKK